MSVLSLEANYLIDDFERERLAASFSSLGVAVIGPPALSAGLAARLREEAEGQRRNSAWHLYGRDNGEICQNTIRSYLGPAARDFLASAETKALLRVVAGLELAPDWSATCFTHYDRPGHYLGMHCDKADACVVAMLVYLDARWPVENGPSDGMRLHVLEGERSDCALRAKVTARSNRILILYGSRHAHHRPAMMAGESLTLLAGCFREVSA